jgi:hypothetical protein
VSGGTAAVLERHRLAGRNGAEALPTLVVCERYAVDLDQHVAALQPATIRRTTRLHREDLGRVLEPPDRRLT